MTNDKKLRLLRLYFWLIGSALFVQGMVSIIVAIANFQLPTFIHHLIITDPLHSFIHVCWGLGILLLLAKRSNKSQLVLLALSYGVFFLILGFLGTFIHNPFGMQLGKGENIFHFFSSVLALIFGIRAIKYF